MQTRSRLKNVVDIFKQFDTEFRWESMTEPGQSLFNSDTIVSHAKEHNQLPAQIL